MHEATRLSMMKMPSAAFLALNRTEQGDLVDKWCGVPVYAHFILKLDSNIMELSVFPFKLQRLPRRTSSATRSGSCGGPE